MNNLALNTSTVDGTLGITVGGSSVTQAGTLSSAGATTITASANGTIVLDNAANQVDKRYPSVRQREHCQLSLLPITRLLN